MKKIFTFVLLALAIGASSCGKRNCWKCTTTFTDSDKPALAPDGSSAARTTYCDKTEDEVRQKTEPALG